jgi:CRP-like cAMP-binding protein
MFDLLQVHILKRVRLTEKELNLARTFFVPKKIRRGQFLLHSGEVCKYIAFVEKGCLRQYYIDNKGEEHVVQFAIEDWWISDMYSTLSGTPATYNIDALENSELLLFERSRMDELTGQIPQFEKFFRLLLEGAFISKERRIAASLGMSAEEQYLCMLDMYPKIVQRVPQHQVASYLGITPQSLSRIRKELADKK